MTKLLKPQNLLMEIQLRYFSSILFLKVVTKIIQFYKLSVLHKSNTCLCSRYIATFVLSILATAKVQEQMLFPSSVYRQ